MNLEQLQPLVSDRAYQLLLAHDASIEELQQMNATEIAQSIHGVGPVMGTEIRDALDALIRPEDPTQPDAADPTIQAAFDRALALLVSCDRPTDVANLKNAARTLPLEKVLWIAIGILQGQGPGDRGQNLAASVKAMLPK